MKIAAYIMIALSLFSSCSKKSNQEIRLVDMNKLFDGFMYTKELKTEFVEKTEAQQYIVDSMINNLKLLENVARTNPLESTLEKYKAEQDKVNFYYQKLENLKDELTQESDSKILKQLNQYLQDYNKQNNIDIMLSKSKDDVSVVFVSDQYDETEKVLEYINKKYEAN